MIRKRYRIVSQKYDKQTNKLLDTKILGRELTSGKANQLIRSYIRGYEALDPGYKNYKSLNEEDYWLFYFYSPNYLKDYYFVLTVEKEKNTL
jgi:hypothetical protein